jgi:hypothetical protein
MTQTITIKDPQAPATPAQISYLTSLVKKHECPTVEEKFRFAQKMGFLAKGAASDLISQALAAPTKQALATPANIASGLTLAEPTPVATATEVAAELTMPAWGYYDIDGTIYHWGVTAKDSYPTLRKLSIVTNYDGTKKGKWAKAYVKWDPKMQIAATWVPYMGKGYNKSEITKMVTIPAQLVGKTPMTLDEAAAKGKAFTFCVKCGATLTDPISVANGIGPVCIKAFI